MITEEDLVEIRDTIVKDSSEEVLMLKHDLTWEQIAWRRDKKRALKRLFPQEYPEDTETCFLTTGEHYFDMELLLQVLERLPDPRKEFPHYKRSHIPGGYKIVWEKPIAGKRYYLGSDCSEGLSTSDPNGTLVINAHGCPVAVVHGKFSINQQSELAREFSREYGIPNGCKRPVWGVERQNQGIAVLNRLETIHNMKHHEVGGVIYGFKKNRLGWDTNDSTRPILLDEMTDMLELLQCDLRWQALVSEMTTFKKQQSGKFEADPGATDDAVIMYGIANQMRKYRPRTPRITVR
jgi:hypothetical protein